MPEFWDQFEGITVAGSYVTGPCRHAGADTACFPAGTPGGGRVLVRLAAGDAAGVQLERWKRIAVLSHPHLTRLIEAGWLAREGAPVAYALLEYPEENLGDVLAERVLTAEETAQVLPAVAGALAYVHAQGLVHGRVAPENIVASGDAVKLAGDLLREPADGATPEEDVRCLGAAVCRMLTGREPGPGGDPGPAADMVVPAPFEQVIRRCLHAAPGKRWSAAQVAASLHALRTVPEPAAAPSGRSRAGRWAWAAVAAGALGIVLLWGTRRGGEAPAAPPPAAPPHVAGRAMAAAPPAPVSAPRPEGAPAAGSAAPAWRVIAYTYNGMRAAEKKAGSINQKWPQFRAEVFAPDRDRGPYLVALGGRMTREEAVRLQREALAKGLPRDTYAQNYRH